MKQTLFDAIGGLVTPDKVHKILYDKVYAHYWLKYFFEGHSQEAIEHRQMYIANELFDIRQELLKESIKEAGVPEDLMEQ